MDKDLHIEANADSPAITFLRSGQLRIEGRAICEDPFSFWQPVLEWARGYAQQPAATTELAIYLEYANSSSTKYISEILYTLDDLHRRAAQVRVVWLYDDDDDTLLRLGQDLQSMFALPFDYQGVNVQRERIQQITIKKRSNGQVVTISHRYWDAIVRNGHGAEYDVVADQAVAS